MMAAKVAARVCCCILMPYLSSSFAAAAIGGHDTVDGVRRGGGAKELHRSGDVIAIKRYTTNEDIFLRELMIVSMRYRGLRFIQIHMLNNGMMIIDGMTDDAMVWIWIGRLILFGCVGECRRRSAVSAAAGCCLEADDLPCL